MTRAWAAELDLTREALYRALAALQFMDKSVHS
jgi:hypothetical protein